MSTRLKTVALRAGDGARGRGVRRIVVGGLVGRSVRRVVRGHAVRVAAASLTNAFTELAKTYQQAHPGWTVKLNFDGSDVLEAQILQHAPADVYAAASPKYPEILQGKKLLGATQNFATNTLLLVTPKSNPAAHHHAAGPHEGQPEDRRRRPGRAARLLHRDGAHEPRDRRDQAAHRLARSRMPRTCWRSSPRVRRTPGSST